MVDAYFWYNDEYTIIYAVGPIAWSQDPSDDPEHVYEYQTTSTFS